MVLTCTDVGEREARELHGSRSSRRVGLQRGVPRRRVAAIAAMAGLAEGGGGNGEGWGKVVKREAGGCVRGGRGASNEVQSQRYGACLV